jgi:hypothetical protein
MKESIKFYTDDLIEQFPFLECSELMEREEIKGSYIVHVFYDKDVRQKIKECRNFASELSSDALERNLDVAFNFIENK